MGSQLSIAKNTTYSIIKYIGADILNLYPKEYRVLMFGLEASGKTTMLYRQVLGQTVNTIPTVGFNVEKISINFFRGLIVWDVGLRSKGNKIFSLY